MPYSKEEVEEYWKKNRDLNVSESDKSLFHRFQILSKAAVEIELLTGDANWDIFLSHLQAVVNEAQEEAQTFREILESETVWGDEDIRRARVSLLLAKERVRLLEHVMQLPAEIKAQGEAAVDLMTRLQKPEETDAAA